MSNLLPLCKKLLVETFSYLIKTVLSEERRFNKNRLDLLYGQSGVRLNYMSKARKKKEVSLRCPGERIPLYRPKERDLKSERKMGPEVSQRQFRDWMDNRFDLLLWIEGSSFLPSKVIMEVVDGEER